MNKIVRRDTGEVLAEVSDSYEPRRMEPPEDNLHLTEYHVTQTVSGGIPDAPRLWALDEDAHVEDYLSMLVAEGYIIGTHDLGREFDQNVARPSVEDWRSDDEVRHWIVEVG